jgi:hypothetical protein
VHAHVDAFRELRADLAPAGLSVEAATEKLEQRAEQKIAEVREREAQGLGRIDRLIPAARELASEVRNERLRLLRMWPIASTSFGNASSAGASIGLATWR